MLDYELMGKRIKELRCIKGLSQAALAEYADVSVPFISHIETGRKQAGLNVLVRIARSLDVSIDYLVGINTGEDASTIFNGCSTYEKHVMEDVAISIRNCLRKYKNLK